MEGRNIAKANLLYDYLDSKRSAAHNSTRSIAANTPIRMKRLSGSRSVPLSWGKGDQVPPFPQHVEGA